MKYIIKNKSKISVSLFGLILSSATYAAAPTNAQGIAEGITAQVSSFMQLALSIGFLFGVVLFIGGLYMLYKDSKQPGQDHAKKGFIGLAVGSALLIAPTLMDVGAGSIAEGQKASGSFSKPTQFDN
jgi:hypothetical protein